MKSKSLAQRSRQAFKRVARNTRAKQKKIMIESIRQSTARALKDLQK